MIRRKHRTIRRRLQTVDRELQAVRHDLRAVRCGRPPSGTGPRAPQAPTHNRPFPDAVPDAAAYRRDSHPVPPKDPTAQTPDPAPLKSPLSLRDDRFADYLASSISTGGPLRHERRHQRNKAIVVTALLLIILVWLLTTRFL